MIFQIIFSVFACIAVLSTYKTSRQHNMSVRGLALWILVWIGAVFIVWSPDSTNTIATVLGIGRGVDVVLYCTITVLFFLLFRLHIKLSTLESHITMLVRNQAVTKGQDSKQS